MKIDVRHIVRDHFLTLVNERTQRISFGDVALFYGLPLVCSALIVRDFKVLPESFYGLAISVFSIFAALLFSVQIALFNIVHQVEKIKDGNIKSPSKGEHLARRLELVREVNSNISYLILLSCLGVAMLLFFAITPRIAVARSAISTYFVTHFILTILLVVARVHTLFDVEYRKTK